MEWNPPMADPKMSTSLFCSCNYSPDFCGTEDLVLYCSTCQTNSYNCINLHSHIESFSAQPASPVLPYDLEHAISPLELHVYKKLFKYSSLMKILRIIALNDFMKTLLSAPTVNTLSNSNTYPRSESSNQLSKT